MEAIERRHVLLMKVQGDTLEDLYGSLVELLNSVEERIEDSGEGLEKLQIIQGGSSASFSVNYQHHPEMSHEKYMEAIKERRRKKESLLNYDTTTLTERQSTMKQINKQFLDAAGQVKQNPELEVFALEMKKKENGAMSSLYIDPDSDIVGVTFRDPESGETITADLG